MNPIKNALVIGGNGLLGYGMVKQLAIQCWNVRSFDLAEIDKKKQIENVEYVTGDLYDSNVLASALSKIDIVFYFISSTIPKTNDLYLDNEISKTLSTLDYVLKMMTNFNVKNFVFPSSGGAVYGDIEQGYAVENMLVHPKTAYGAGKILSEQILNFYYMKHGINSCIFRIGNVYGSPLYRRGQQCAIDIFIQNALEELPVTIWGSAESVIRDYIFLDDVTEAVVMVSGSFKEGVNIYNVGTGVGVNLKEVIRLINKYVEKPLLTTHDIKTSSGVDRIILDTSKIMNEFMWRPAHDLENGIKDTVLLKKLLLLNIKE